MISITTQEHNIEYANCIFLSPKGFKETDPTNSILKKKSPKSYKISLEMGWRKGREGGSTSAPINYVAFTNKGGQQHHLEQKKEDEESMLSTG